MHVAMHEGQIRWDAAANRFSLVPNTKGLATILEQLDSDEAERAFELYAWAKRANRLKPLGKEPAPQSDIDSGLAIVREFPIVATVFDEWTEFNRAVLRVARDAGLIDDTLLSKLESDTTYVPFFRAEIDADPRFRRLQRPTARRGAPGLSEQRGVKGIKGSERQTESIIDNMVMNTTRLLDASYKNRAADAAVRLMEDANGVLGEAIVQKVPMDWRPSLVPVGTLEAQLLKAGVTSVDFTNLTPADRRSLALVFGMVPPTNRHGGRNVISWMRGGKIHYRIVNDGLLFNTLAALTPHQLSWLGRMIVQALSAPSRWLRFGITNTPGFAVRNFLRDTASSITTTGASPARAAKALRDKGELPPGRTVEHMKVRSAAVILPPDQHYKEAAKEALIAKPGVKQTSV